MLGERKFKKPSANVVARLMGFDGVSYQQPPRTHCQGYFPETRLKEDEACKDVHIVHETLKAEKVRRRSVEYYGFKGNFEAQRFVSSAQHLAINKKSHRRVNAGDPPFVVDSNKEVFVEFLRNPTPLLTKHFHGLQSYDAQARCFRNTARNTMKVPLSEHKDAGRNSSRQQEPLSCSTRSPGIGKQNILKHSTSWSESDYEMSNFPAKIVVLEPNRRRSGKQHTAESIRPPHSYYASDSDYATNKINISKSSNVEQYRRNNYGHQVELSLGRSEEPRRMSRKKIRGLRTAALDFLPKKSAGYAGDESSFYLSEDEYEDVLDSWNSVDSFSRSSLFHSANASLRVKHKNYLSEHCQASGKLPKTGSSKRITLGKILSVPDKEIRERTSNSRIDGPGTDTYGFEANGNCMCQLGIHSLETEYSRSSSRNVSGRGQSVALGVHKSSVLHKIVENDSSLWTATNSRLCSDPSQVDISENKTIPYRTEKFNINSHIRRSSSRGNGDYSNKVLVSLNQQKNINSKTYKAEASNSMLHHVSKYEHPIQSDSPTPLEVAADEDVKNCQFDMLTSQEVFIQDFEDVSPPTTNEVPGSIFPVGSKEAEWPSPVSVLEFPKVDASSYGSEYFGRVSADLQGLRAQVLMLKLELAQDDNEPELLHNNDNYGKATVSSLEEKVLVLDEISDSSYLDDVLVVSGFDDGDPSVFLSAWDLPYVPMELSVFENLENKYGEKAAWPRSERRLLFDHINSELAGILKHYTNPCLWGESVTRLLVPVHKNVLKDSLCKLLIGQEQNGSDENFEQRGVVHLDRIDLWGNIHEIGREVEDTLVDELVAEVIGECL